MAEKNSLWKNIRKKAEQNRRTGNKPKEPTKEMLDQERKIKAKQYYNGGPTGDDDKNKLLKGENDTLLAPTLNTQVVEEQAPQWIRDKETLSPDEINFWESFNPKKWGLNDYSNYSSFNSAFRNARESGEKEFVWNKNRYTTELAPKEVSDAYLEDNYSIRQPETINVVDKRKYNPITKKPINPNRDLVGGKFEDTIPIEIITSAYKHGVDPATALSVGLLESRMGTTDSNVGHIMVDPYSDYMPGAEDMVLKIKEKQNYAKKLGYTDPLLQLQAYNGLGVLSNKRGEVGKSAYGLPIPKEGLDLRKNPLYGKKVKNVRDSVIMQSPDLVRLMNQYKPKATGGYMYDGGGDVIPRFANIWDNITKKIKKTDVNSPEYVNAYNLNNILPTVEDPNNPGQYMGSIQLSPVDIEAPKYDEDYLEKLNEQDPNYDKKYNEAAKWFDEVGDKYYRERRSPFKRFTDDLSDITIPVFEFILNGILPPPQGGMVYDNKGNLIGESGLTPVYPEMALAPSSLGLKGGKNLIKKAGVEILEALNPISGFKGKPKLSASSNVDPVIDSTPTPWSIQEMPGLHLKSTMTTNPKGLHTQVAKDGTINTENALKFIKNNEGEEKYNLIRKAFEDNIPKKMDYNEFRKVVQDQLIPLERQFRKEKSAYGIADLGYVPKSEQNIFQRLKTKLNIALGLTPLENQTLILSNKDKFGIGSSAHDNPEETLGHIHFLRDAKTPDILTVTQIQSDAFQSKYHYVNNLKSRLEYLKKALDGYDNGDPLSYLNNTEAIEFYGKENYEKKFINPKKWMIEDIEKEIVEALGNNPIQKQLLDKNHEERFLQELVNYAGERGDVNKIRVPTSETAAKVQGYKKIEIPIDKDFINPLPANATEAQRAAFYRYIDALKKGEKLPSKIDYSLKHQTVLKKYSDQPKMIKKLFGVEPKVITDGKGNTWYEFDIPESFKGTKGEIKAFSTGGIIAAPTSIIGAGAMQGSQPEQQSQGGHINPYMYYAGGPMQSTNNKYLKNNIMKYKRGGGIGGFFKDYGKIMLNAYASPFEALAGKDFYDPEYNTKFGEIADVVNETTTKIGLPIAGSMLLGPQGYQAVKKGTEILSNEFIDTPQQQQQQYPQQQYPPNVNQGLSFAATGGLLNNKEYLVNSQIDSMRNRYKTYKTKYRQGGSMNQSNVDFISDEAGLHQENVYNGVPLTRGEGAYANGGAALVEAGEGVIRDKQGNPSFILPDQGDGEPVYMLKPNASHTGFEKDKNGNYIQLPITVADWRKQQDKGSKFRDQENNVLSNPRKDKDNQLAMDATEIQKQLKAQRDMNNEMMVEGALQIAAAGGKLNKDLEKILSNDIQKYVEADNYYAYGGYLPKDKGFNMPNSYSKGGNIHIKKSKRGTFTAAAKKRGKSVQEFARQVLANKGNYSAAMVKKANFARNAASWKHAEGGDIRPDNPGFNALPEYVQAKIMNNMAQGGPMVSNVAQPFQVAAQNRGGMMMANGGMMQQSSQQDQMMQMVQQVQEMLMQGANPQELLKQLMKSGLPQDQAQQLVQAAMQDLESQQQPQQTQMAMGGNMYANGGPPYDLPGMFDMTANPGTRTIESTGETWEDPGTMYEYDAINNYLTNLDTPNVIDAQGNATSILDRQKNINTTTPNPINNFLNTARNYLSARDYLKQRGFRVGNKSMNSMTQVQQPNINPTNQPSPFLTQLLPESLQPKNYNYDQPMTEFDTRMSNNPVTNRRDPIELIPRINITETNDPSKESVWEKYYNSETAKLNKNISNDINNYDALSNLNNVNTNTDTPWYKEPFYSKAARYSPLFASAAGVITGLQNKKRSLTPEDILPYKVNLERSRITTAEENRRGLETALRTVTGGAGSSGQLNAAARDLVLTGNKNIAANINKLYEAEENTNAQLAQQAALANQQYRNQFKITNEEMFQNAQKQALRAAQEGAQNIQGAAQDERAQYLQEWIAQNRLNTRSYKTNINGQDVYINPDGKVYDINGNPITV